MSARAAFAALLLAGASACANAPPEQSYSRGVEALRAGDARTARIEFLNAIKAEPSNSKLRLAQAETYLRLGDGASAEAELRHAIKLGVAEGAVAHLLAHALVIQGQAEEAAAAAAKASPEHAPYAARMLGRALQAMGRMDEAADAFDRALAAMPDDSALWTDIGRFRRATAETAGAIEAADRAVALDPRNHEALALRAELTRAQYGLAASIPWFDRALAIDPDYVPALVERAATLGDLGRTRSMLADTRRILSVSPNNPWAYYLQAMLAARGRNFNLARSLYSRTEGRLEGQPAPTLLAGIIDLATANPVQAARRLGPLVVQQPANLKARRLLGIAQMRSGDAASAVRTLSPIADRPDADAYTLTVIGEALAKLGDDVAASRYLARASVPGPSLGTVLAAGVNDAELTRLRREADSRRGDAVPQVELIRGLLVRGLAGEALQRAVRLQAMAPGVPEAHLLVGDALAIRGDHRGAAAAYRKSANLAFTEPTALRLVEALQNAGDHPAAAQVLGLFLSQNPQNVSAQLLAANMHIRAGQWEEAIPLYESVRRRLGNGDAVLLNNLAWAYAETGDFDRALPLAKRAWQLDPRNPATADTLGWLLFRSGEDRVQGLALLEKAFRGAPTDDEIRAHLERARAGASG